MDGRGRVLGFRLGRHHLAERAPNAALLDVAGVCGVPDTPPGLADLALDVRLAELPDLGPHMVEHRDLVRVRSLRDTSLTVPARDLPVFTLGLAPRDEAECRYMLAGAAQLFEVFGLSASRAVELTDAAAGQALAGRPLTEQALWHTAADLVAGHLAPSDREGWEEASGLQNHTYGQVVVRYALSVVFLSGRLCMLPKTGREATRVALTDWWLPTGAPTAPAREARAELARRFLACYGPSDPGVFAAWTGTTPAFAEHSFELLGDRIVQIPVDWDPPVPYGRGAALRGARARDTAYLLREDAEVLATAQMPRGVRLLPPGDAYLAEHDRGLLAGRDADALFWRAGGRPGGMLVDGELMGAWRATKHEGRLDLAVTLFPHARTGGTEAMAEAVDRMAAVRCLEPGRLDIG